VIPQLHFFENPPSQPDSQTLVIFLVLVLGFFWFCSSFSFRSETIDDLVHFFPFALALPAQKMLGRVFFFSPHFVAHGVPRRNPCWFGSPLAFHFFSFLEAIVSFFQIPVPSDRSGCV